MMNPSNQTNLNENVLEIGARLNHQPSKNLIDLVFAEELNQQLCLFESMGLVDLAYTLVSIKTGIIPIQNGRELISKLLELHMKPDSFFPTPELGDLYTNREAWLSKRTDAVGWLGIGRARREATTSAFLVETRRRIVNCLIALSNLGMTIVERSKNGTTEFMADYTYLQSAQPTTFGHYLLSFAYPLMRDCERLRQLYVRVNSSPLGCGSTTGSSLVKDRQQMADLLGFEGISIHTRDAMWQADIPIEAASVLSTCTVNMSRLSEDLQIFSTQEFGLIELDDCHARASKVMPHKKNPFALAYIRGLCNELVGTVTTACSVGRTPSGQPDNRLWAYGAIPQAFSKVQGAAELLNELIDRLTFNNERGQELFQEISLMATDLTEYMVREHDLDFRMAHRFIGYLIRQCIQNDRKIDKVLIEEAALTLFGREMVFDTEQLQEALDPIKAIKLHHHLGSPSEESMEQMLDCCSKKFNGIGDEVKTLQNQLKLCEAQLFDQARNMVNL